MSLRESYSQYNTKLKNGGNGKEHKIAHADPAEKHPVRLHVRFTVHVLSLRVFMGKEKAGEMSSAFPAGLQGLEP